MLQYFDNAMICTAWAVWTVGTFRLTAFTTFLSHIAVTIMQGYVLMFIIRYFIMPVLITVRRPNTKYFQMPLL